jgi:hypothetical protein
MTALAHQFGLRPQANGALRQEDTPRVESLIRLVGSKISLRVMIYRGHVSSLRSLVILNSVEYPMPPSVAFCERMWARGLQVIFVERPGFGSTASLPTALFTKEMIANGATAATEAVILQKLIRQLELEDVVLLGMGSANPVSYRLAMIDPCVSLAVYSNVVFNKDILDVFRPKWLQQMFRQMVQSNAGLKITSMGFKHRLRHKPIEFYRHLMHQSAGDMAYLDANRDDFLAAARLFQNIDHALINFDMKMSLATDHILKDDFFRGRNAVALSGTETPDHWQTQLNSETARLGIPVAYAPAGDFLAPYASPDFFSALVETHSGGARASG